MYNQYDNSINHYSVQFGVPAIWIRAIIGAESDGNPQAFRQEGADASYGLMQVLLSTARGLGYSGDSNGLYDPDTNIMYGTMLLGQLIQKCGTDPASVYSAYNSGGCNNYNTNTTVMAHVQRFLTYLTDAQASDGGTDPTPDPITIDDTSEAVGLGLGLVIITMLYFMFTKGR